MKNLQNFSIRIWTKRNGCVRKEIKEQMGKYEVRQKSWIYNEMCDDSVKMRFPDDFHNFGIISVTEIISLL